MTIENTVTKRISALLLLFVLCLNTVFMQGCSKNSEADSFDIANIQSYRDIPGVTAEEITAVEALKASVTGFSYGCMPTTETFTLPNGELAGFTALFCDLLSGLFGVPFVQETHNWDSLKSGLDDKTIDFVSNLTPTPERKSVYFMTHPISERTLNIYTYGDSVKINTEEDVDGLKIGFDAGTITAQSVRDAYPELSFEVVDVQNTSDSVEKLKSGVIDAFVDDAVGSYAYIDYGSINAKGFFPLVYTPVSLTTANPELEPVISVMNKYISSGGVDKLYELRKQGEDEYAKYNLYRSFGEEEAAYIAALAESGASVRVALETDNYPVSFYDENQSEFQGIVPDILAEVSSLTGIKFEIATDKDTTWSEIMEKLRTGDVALVSELQRSREREKDFIWADEPYFTSHYALISKTDYPNVEFYRVARATVGVVKDSAHEELYDTWFSDNPNTKRYDTHFEALDALESGEIDLFMASETMLLTQMNYREKPGYKANYTFTSWSEKSFFGFNKDEKTLCSVINNVQKYIETEKIVKDWSSRVYDYSKNLAESRIVLLTVFSSVFAVIVFMLVFVLLQSARRNRVIKKQSAFMAAIYDALPDTIISKDINSRYTSGNHAFEKMTGLSEAELIGKTTLELFPENAEMVDALKESDQSILNNGEIVKTEYWFTFPDKTRRYFETVRTPIKEDGKLVGMVGISRDITEAYESNAILKSVLNNVDALIYVTVPETGEILFVNDFMKKNIFETPSEELIGEYCYKVFRNEDKMCEFCPCYKLRENPDEVVVWDEYLPMYDGHIRHSDCLIDWPNRGKVHLQYAVDITELSAAKESAEQSNRSKGFFIAQMSHEIRTPMNAILGISEIQLRDGQISADAEEAFRQIYDSGNLLLNIINDILDFSKIDAGKMEIIPYKYDTPSLINDTVQLCRLRYGNKPIEFILRVDENTPLNLVGDELRIRQILNNLLSNAFKYTNTGEVRMSFSSEKGDTDETAILVLKIADTGQGMTKDQIDRIFDEYSRFNMRTNQGIPGTGLGMNITKRLIDMMNGEILVDSEAGKGSTFTVRLPQRVCSSEICGAELAKRLQDFSFNNNSIIKRAQIVHEYMPYGKVLVVDDVESNLFVAKGLMIPYGLRIETAKSGFEAVERILKNGERYDIVFMDHMMPVMDGMQATKTLRESGYDQPIVALTANAITGQSEMFLSNGFDKFISKPVDSRELDLVLKELIKDRTPPEIIEAAQREKYKAVKHPKIDLTELEKYFVMDAQNAIETLESVCARLGNPDGADMDTDIQQYTTAVHGIKSPLVSVGEKTLSEIAFKLEIASKARNFKAIAEETPPFINNLKALIARLKPKETETAAVEVSDEDMAYLKEKMLKLQSACEDYNIRAAETVLNDVKQRKWSRDIDGIVNEISLLLLRGEFEEVVAVSRRITVKAV